MLIPESLKRQLLAAVAAGTLTMIPVPAVHSAECGCDLACDQCAVEVLGCDCGCGEVKKGCCLSNGFRSLHVGFKKFCDLKWCDFKLLRSSDHCCDDACDAALMEDLMFPPESVPMPQHVYGDVDRAPATTHRHVPSLDPATPMRLAPSQRDSIEVPVRIKEQGVDSDLFKALPDPFRDDEVRLRSDSGVRPSSHDEVMLRPAPTPLSRAQGSSSRRSRSLR